MSSSAESEVLYYADDDFNASEITHLQNLQNGYTPIRENEANQRIALDYVRGNLFDPTKMIPLPHEVTGENNDLNDFIETYMNEAKKKMLLSMFTAHDSDLRIRKIKYSGSNQPTVCIIFT